MCTSIIKITLIMSCFLCGCSSVVNDSHGSSAPYFYGTKDYGVNKYAGQFSLDGKRNGFGTWTYSDGGKYIGQWKDDFYHGAGTEYSSNGAVIKEGIWDKGRFINSVKIQQTDLVKQDLSTKYIQSSPLSIDGKKGIAIEEAKIKCTEIGFINNTEGFGKCVLQLSK
jgi:hypothetical protein